MRAKFIISALLVSGLIGTAYVFVRDKDAQDDGQSAVALDASNDAALEIAGRLDERDFLRSLIKQRPQPIAIQDVDDFVTQDQNLAIPPRAALRHAQSPALVLAPKLAFDSSLNLESKADSARVSSIEVGVSAVDRDIDVSTHPVYARRLVRERPLELDRLRPSGPDTDVAARPLGSQPEIIAPLSGSSNEPFVDRHATAPQDTALPFTVSIGELLRQHGEQVEPDDLFYVHSVSDSDGQGIWGIIQQGVTRSFARGVKVAAETGDGTLRLDIPTHADERLNDNSSSFLGKLIHRKVRRTYIYNFKENRMGRNPDIVRPGQEIVIVRFRPHELVSIYRHFHQPG